MSPHNTAATPVIVALKAITLLLGGLITYFSYKAYSRSGARPLWYLAVGFGVVTIGTLLAGIVDQLLRFSVVNPGALPFTAAGSGSLAVTDLALVLESTLTALGFAVIVYSLYSE
jgi:hypothetical protein